MSAEMNVPKALQEQIEALGFAAVSWDDDLGAIAGHGQEFVGSISEIRAYLTAWSASAALAASKHLVPRLPWTIVGLCSTLMFDPGAVGQITSNRLSFAFRGFRLAVPDHVAPHFEVQDVRVGNRSQFVATQELPATAFASRVDDRPMITLLEREGRVPQLVEVTERAATEFGQAFEMTACRVGEQISIIIRNTSDQPRAFSSFVLGRAAVAP